MSAPIFGLAYPLIQCPHPSSQPSPCHASIPPDTFPTPLVPTQRVNKLRLFGTQQSAYSLAEELLFLSLLLLGKCSSALKTTNKKVKMVGSGYFCECLRC